MKKANSDSQFKSVSSKKVIILFSSIFVILSIIVIGVIADIKFITNIFMTSNNGMQPPKKIYLNSQQMISQKVKDPAMLEFYMGLFNKRWIQINYGKHAFYTLDITHKDVQWNIKNLKRRMSKFPDTRRAVTGYYATFEQTSNIFLCRDQDSRLVRKYKINFSGGHFKERMIPYEIENSAGVKYRGIMFISKEGNILTFKQDNNEWYSNFVWNKFIL